MPTRKMVESAQPVPTPNCYADCTLGVMARQEMGWLVYGEAQHGRGLLVLHFPPMYRNQVILLLLLGCFWAYVEWREEE